MTVKYRPDVDGLRAFAVFPVIFFHAGHPWFTGGFLGVDVFFVISGFLITSFIVSNLASESFSFKDFYDRRARRILPALLVVILSTTLLSYFFMLPNDLKSYGQSVVATVLSANNILLFLTSGYWSLAAEFKPLYHTWSLGVEEQFYLIVPIVLTLVFVLSRSVGFVFLVIAVGAFSSFVYSLYVTDSEFNFLIIFTRAWELLVGSIGALIAIRIGLKNSNALSIIGLCLIVISYVYPYAIANTQAIVNLPAVLGTFLIILSCVEPGNPVHRLLTLKPLVFMGLLSYGIYLWHQPALAFLRLSSEYPPHYLVLSLCGLIALPLSYLSWRFIERPLRNRETTPAVFFYSSIALISICLVSIGYYFHISYGLEEQRKEFTYGGDPRAYVDRVYKLKTDSFSDLNKVNVSVVGNSFARDFVNTILEFEGYDASKIEVVYKVKSCESALEENSELLKSSDHVVFASDWGLSGYSKEQVENLTNCITRVSSNLSGQVFVLGSKNFGWNNNFVLRYDYDNAVNLRTQPLASVEQFNAEASKSIGDDFINVLQPLKDADGEVPIFTSSGEFITYDTNHLTPAGARFLGEVLFSRTKLAAIFNRDLVADR